MKFIIGQGLHRFVPPHAVVCINNFKGEQQLGESCMVELVNGYSFLASGSAEQKHAELMEELTDIHSG